MRTRHFTLGIALLLLTGTVVAAAADTQHFHCKGGGSFTDGVETNIDTSGVNGVPDGVSATVDQGAEVCNTGNAVFQEEVELIPRPVSSACPAGTTNEFYVDATHGQERAVFTDEETGDQTFTQNTSMTECLNAATGRFTGHGRGIIIGGTGKNTNATGTYQNNFSGSYLQAGFKNGVFGGFGQVTFTSNGTLILPKGGHGKED